MSAVECRSGWTGVTRRRGRAVAPGAAGVPGAWRSEEES